MNGMEMLMKSFGFDPEQLKRQFGDAMVQLQNRTLEIELSLKRIEARQMMMMDALHVVDPARAMQEAMTHGPVN